MICSVTALRHPHTAFVPMTDLYTRIADGFGAQGLLVTVGGTLVAVQR